MKHLPAAVAVTLLAAGLAAGATGTAASAEGDARSNAIAHANASIQHRPAAVAGSRDDRYSVRDVIVDSDGAEHVRYDRTYKGLPVLGGDFVVHGRGNGDLTSVSKTQRGALSLSTTPTVSSDEAAAKAASSFPGTVQGQSTPALLVDTRRGEPALAWGVVVTGTTNDGDPSELHDVIDAASGEIRDSWDGIETAKPQPQPSSNPQPASGNTLYSGTVTLTTNLASGVFSLKDLTRGGQTTSDMAGRTNGSGTLVTSSTSSFGNGQQTDPKTVAADAAYGVATTWDYYQKTFGRNGIGGDGKGAASRVHYGRNYSNAFWSDSCFCMTFGDGTGTGATTPLVSLDVAGHEMTHGVTSRTANLTYSGESGGLNEATSDIFGTMVEFSANNTSDVGDYLVGEKVHPDAHPIRWMDDPAKDGYSASCWTPSVGSLNVHYSSGVANHFFYLLAVGSGKSTYGTSPTCDGSTVTGIGNTAAAAIWYRAVTTYMTSSTNYAGARAATVQAAADLYPAAADGAPSPQSAAVVAAWNAVAVS